RGRKRNMAELVNERVRTHRTQELWNQRKVIVLNPCHAPTGVSLGFVGHGVRKSQVDRAIAVPEFCPVLEVVDEHVAQWPQRSVRESVVVSFDLVVLQPDAAQRVALFTRRNLYAAGIVGRFPVRVSGSPCHPGAMNATHRGIERRNKPSGWLPHLDSARPTNVFVRLAIRDENELAVVERSEEHTSELQSPDHLVCRLLLE